MHYLPGIGEIKAFGRKLVAKYLAQNECPEIRKLCQELHTNIIM
jgi:hypothetical protein